MIETSKFKILTISWDPTLAMDKPSFGDVQKRNIDYGKQVSAIHSITYSPKKLNLKQKQISENVVAYPTNSTSRIIFLIDAWRLAKKICLENKIDLVLTQDPFLTGLVGSWVKKKFGCKLLIHYHGDFWQNENWLKERWYNLAFYFIQRFVLRRADALRVMSGGQREKFLKTGWAPSRVRVISTPIDLEKFKTNAYDGNKPNSKYVLHVGRNDIVKDYDTLVKAFDIVSNKVSNVFFLEFGGRDELIKAMDRQRDISLNVQSIKAENQINHDELIKFYNMSDVLVLSSTSESFGKVLVEANACGKPIVSTATTGAKEIVKDGYNGFLVPIGDAKALADKILELLNNPELAEKMGVNGRTLVSERFDGRKNTELIIRFWSDIINNNL